MSEATKEKNIELFHDLLPSLKRVAVLVNAKDPIFAKAMIDEAVRAHSRAALAEALPAVPKDP